MRSYVLLFFFLCMFSYSFLRDLGGERGRLISCFGGPCSIEWMDGCRTLLGLGRAAHVSMEVGVLFSLPGAGGGEMRRDGMNG